MKMMFLIPGEMKGEFNMKDNLLYKSVVWSELKKEFPNMAYRIKIIKALNRAAEIGVKKENN